jgi:hypothetical protein
MGRFVNLTPHDIHIHRCLNDNESDIITLKPEGLARCEVVSELVDTVGGISIYENVYGGVFGLPELVEITDENHESRPLYIVSLLVASAVRGLRPDVYVTNDVVRDDAGKIIGCRSLAQV